MNARAPGMALAALLVAACGESVAPLDTALLSELGDYAVVAVSSASTPLVPVDVTDDLLVVGSTGTTPEKPFAWKDGTLTLLGDNGAEKARAVAVNEQGDILGDAGEPVLWRLPSPTPIPVLPASSPHRSARTVDISNSSAILLLAPSGGSSVILEGGTHGVARIIPSSTGRLFGPDDDVIGVSYQLYATLMVWSASGDVRCSWFQHGVAEPRSVNSAGKVVARMTNTAGDSYDRLEVLTTRGQCARAIPEGTAAIADIKGINDDDLMVGVVDNEPGVMRLGRAGFLRLDDLLAQSSGDSPEWDVTAVIKVTNGGVFLAKARRGGQEQIVLLVPRGRSAM